MLTFGRLPWFSMIKHVNSINRQTAESASTSLNRSLGSDLAVTSGAAIGGLKSKTKAKKKATCCSYYLILFASLSSTGIALSQIFISF